MLGFCWVSGVWVHLWPLGDLLISRYTTGAGSEVVDGASFLLTTNPDWWLGEWGCEPRLPFPTPALALGPVST